MGRATRNCRPFLLLSLYFYPRPPWGGRLPVRSREKTIWRFLSTPSVGRATLVSSGRGSFLRFLSTPSVGRATWFGSRQTHSKFLFLSTPSVGRATSTPISPSRAMRNFYPRPPWGGRPCAEYKQDCADNISIHALRGEGDRLPPCTRPCTRRISIHALRGEGDLANKKAKL